MPHLRQLPASITGRFSTLMVPLFLLTAVATPAQAQFGKLKKMGADAIKDAAKDKMGTDKKEPAKGAPGASSNSSAKSSAAILDDDRIALVLASLAPQVRDAEVRDAAARTEAAWKIKVKEREACMARAQQNPDPMKLMAAAQKNEAKITANTKLMEAAQNRVTKAYDAKDMRRASFLQDTVNTYVLRNAVLSFDLPCVVEFTPAVLIEEQLQRSTDRGDGDGFDPGDAVRGVMTRYDYGLVRERIALWSLLQADPTLKGLGKQGVFSPEEQAALGKHAVEIRKLAPLFKSDAMIWKSWSDLKSW